MKESIHLALIHCFYIGEARNSTLRGNNINLFHVKNGMMNVILNLERKANLKANAKIIYHQMIGEAAIQSHFLEH